MFFSDSTNTGCGQASAQTGPFYCPVDRKVYFDLDFLTQLQDTFGATGDLAAQYIVAHEYGHHIQNLVGINEQMRQAQQADPSRANQYSVALELQADCFAGAWARQRPATEGSSTTRRRSRRRSTPPPPSVTTASSRRRKGGSIPSRSRTARRRNASHGSSAASTPATPTAARRSAKCCRRSGVSSPVCGRRIRLGLCRSACGRRRGRGRDQPVAECERQ